MTHLLVFRYCCRAFKYLKESTGTRLIAVAGCFVSVPLFILGK
jgi:hypothetical protein